MKKIIILILLIPVLYVIYLSLYSQVNTPKIESSPVEYSKVVTSGTISFIKNPDVDIEDWAKDEPSLALVFVERGKGSGISEGGCGAGQQFIEISEQYSDRYTSGSPFINLGKETFGTNIYDVFDFRLNEDESIRYYVILNSLQGGEKSIEIAYRPNNCVSKSYEETFKKVLETFKFSNK